MVPSFMSHIIAATTLALPAMIISETSLSFLGLGLRPPAVSWGVLLQQAQNIQTVAISPWLMIPVIPVIIAVLAFNFRYWRHQRLMVAAVCTGILLMTMADVLLPIYAGRLIDAVAPAIVSAEGGNTVAREAALGEAAWALAAMVVLGLLMVVMRHLSFLAVVRHQGVVPFALEVVGEDVAQIAFILDQQDARFGHKHRCPNGH